MKIEEGKFYHARNGEKIGPMEGNWCDSICWPFVCKGEHPAMYWRKNGEACAGSIEKMRPELDLVAEWTDESTGPVRTVTRKEIVSGYYGGVKVVPYDDSRVHISIGSTLNADEIRAAAATLTEIADALAEQAN